MTQETFHFFTVLPIGAIKKLLRAFRQGGAGGEGVHQNALRRELKRHGLGEVDDRRLRRHEGALKPGRNEAEDGRNVDDAAAAPRLHLLHHTP